VSEQPTTLVGMSWYRAEDYPAIQRIMEDKHTLFRTFHEWRMAAENGEKQLTRKGIKVIRAYIDPNTFPEWCRSRGYNVNAEARKAYAVFIADQHRGNVPH